MVAVGRRLAPIEVDPSRWPVPTRREFYAHLEAHGLDRKTPDPVGALRKAELARGQAIDRRVTTAQLDELLALSAEAAQLIPQRQNVFFGFSRLIDAKFDCTPAVLQGLIDRVLAEGQAKRGVSGPVDWAISADELSRYLDEGPGNGDLIWSKPETPAQLVASLIRQPAHDMATSVPVSMSHDLARWLKDALGQIGKPLKMAMGGAAAFGANLAAVMNELATGKPLGVDFYAWEDHAPEIGQLFGPGVQHLDRSGERCLPSARISDDQRPRRNYIAAFPPPKPFELRVGARVLRIDPVANGGRFVLATPATQTTTFGDVSPEALRTIAEKHDTFFFSGLHYLSADLPGAATFRQQLDAIHHTRPAAQAHFEYAKAKAIESEHALMQALSGGLYSMSMNPGSELTGLIHRLSEAGLTERRWPKDLSSEDAETPALMVEAAEQLMKTMQLKRLHFHAMTGDLLVIDGARNPRRQVLALLRARQFVTMKAANPTGEIRLAHGRHKDVWPIHATFPGEYLAAEHDFADAMQARFSLSSSGRDQIVRDRYYRDPGTDRLYVFVPSRGLRDKHGGTISAGDTIDLVALLLGREEPGDSAKKRTRALL